MKCVLSATDNKITRVSDDRASYLVELAGSHSFTSKKDWKNQRPVVIVATKEVEEILTPGTKPKKVPGKKSAYREEVKRKRIAQKGSE